jgi:hypothetical protein
MVCLPRCRAWQDIDDGGEFYPVVVLGAFIEALESLRKVLFEGLVFMDFDICSRICINSLRSVIVYLVYKLGEFL